MSSNLKADDQKIILSQPPMESHYLYDVCISTPSPLGFRKHDTFSSRPFHDISEIRRMPGAFLDWSSCLLLDEKEARYKVILAELLKWRDRVSVARRVY